MNKIIILFLFLFIPFMSVGQFLQFTNYSTQDGLAGDNVKCIIIDNNGTYWIGTADGLASYNGNIFSNYTTNEGLISNDIKNIEIDNQNKIWIGTRDGISVFDGNTFTNYTTNEGLIGNEVNDIQKDGDGNIWIATSAGISVFNGSVFINYSSNDGLPTSNILQIEMDNNSIIWVGTASGLCRFNNPGFTTFTTADGLASNYIKELKAKDKIYIYAGGPRISVYDGNAFTLIDENNGLPSYGMLKDIDVDSESNIWMAYEDKIIKYNYKGVYYISSSNTNLPYLTTAINGIEVIGDSIYILSEYEGYYSSHLSQMDLDFIPFTYDNDSIIYSCFNYINSDSIEWNMRELESYGNRYMLLPNRREIAEWLKNRFIQFGYTNSFIDSFQTHTDYSSFDTITWQYNVIARLLGSQYPDSSVIVGAHYDSYSYSSYSSLNFLAPGADDNASGVSAVLEIARVFKQVNYSPLISIKFIAFAAEELMSHSSSCGSSNYAEQADSINERIKYYLNLDMIANNESQTNYNVKINTLNNSREVSDFAFTCCSTYTSVEPYISSGGGSDHLLFFYFGFKTVSLIEYDFSPYYHSENDIVDNCNIDYCTEITKVALSMLVNSSKTTNIKKHIHPEVNLIIFPNPTTGNITIHADGIKRIEIMNIEGRLVYNDKETNREIDLKHFPKGIYIVKVTTNKGVAVEKVIIE